MNEPKSTTLRSISFYMIGPVIAGIIGFLADLSWAWTVFLAFVLASPFWIYEWTQLRKESDNK